MNSNNLKIIFTSVNYAVLFHIRALILQKNKAMDYCVQILIIFAAVNLKMNKYEII